MIYRLLLTRYHMARIMTMLQRQWSSEVWLAHLLHCWLWPSASLSSLAGKSTSITIISLFTLSRFRRRKRHGFNPWLFVAKPACFGHGCHFPTVTQRAIRTMRISPEFFQEMLNRSISVVCLMRSVVNYDQFQTTDHVQICSGCVPASTVIYGFLRSVAVDYGRNDFF